MQHDVCINPSRLSRQSFPFIVLIEQDFAHSDERLCAPLLQEQQRGLPSRGSPTVIVNGSTFQLILQQMRPFSGRLLRRPVGSIAAYRDDIVRALDWLFTGF